MLSDSPRRKPPLSAAIRSIRKRLGITQAALASMLCVAPNTISRWERGEMAPTGWRLFNLYTRAETEAEITLIRSAISGAPNEGGATSHKTSVVGRTGEGS